MNYMEIRKIDNVKQYRSFYIEAMNYTWLACPKAEEITDTGRKGVSH
ncbi:MAG: hypothetical protein WAM14_27345 [Candidatus Nitrosopolaris sp.]